MPRTRLRSAALICTVVTAFAASTYTPATAWAYEVKRSAEGKVVHWARPTVAWTIDKSVRKVRGGEAAVTAALDAWSERGGAPALYVAATRAKLEPGPDGTNGVFFAPDGFEPAGDALAVTILTYDDRTGEILDADIVLNGKYRFAPASELAPRVAGAPEDPAEPHDLSRVLAHEVGHALGLADESKDTDALMYPITVRGRQAVPGEDDIEGIRTIYVAASSDAPLPDEAQGCAVASRAERSRAGTCAGPSGGATPSFGAALALAALALARRGRACKDRCGGGWR